MLKKYQTNVDFHQSPASGKRILPNRTGFVSPANKLLDYSPFLYYYIPVFCPRTKGAPKLSRGKAEAPIFCGGKV